MAVVKGFGFAGSDRPAGKGDGGRGLGSCGGRRHMAGDGTWRETAQPARCFSDVVF